MKIKDTDKIIIKTKIDLSSMGPTKTHVFKTKKMGLIPFSLFIDKNYYTWYELKNEKLEEFVEPIFSENDNNLHEKTALKKKNKKINKRCKLIQAIPITPISVFEYYSSKHYSLVANMGLAEFSYILLSVQFGKKVLIQDCKKEIVKTALKIMDNINFVDIKDYVYGVKYDSLVIIENKNSMELIKLHKNSVLKFIIFSYSRNTADQVFGFLLDNPSFINVNMVDFFMREYQVNENVHPIVRGNTSHGYVITAYSVLID